jgi:predicted transcriptional regulator
LAYTTVMTTLDRLYKKGILIRRNQGKAYLYSPAFTKVEYQSRLTQHVLGIALEDAKYSNAVLSRFVDAVTAADSTMLDQLDELVKAKRRALRRAR